MLSGPEKTRILAQTGRKHHAATLVETGTADHLNIVALANDFDRLYTIELDHDFYLQAEWATMDLPQITCLWGDSADVIGHLSHRLDGTVLYWLDAHYCGGVRGNTGDTPVAHELREIFYYRAHAPNVVLIDDARLFGVDPAYPTWEWLNTFLEDLAERSDVTHGYSSLEVRDDIIRILPS